MEDDLFEEKLEVHSELSLASNIELFTKIVNEFQLLAVFTKTILDV